MNPDRAQKVRANAALTVAVIASIRSLQEETSLQAALLDVMEDAGNGVRCHNEKDFDIGSQEELAKGLSLIRKERLTGKVQDVTDDTVRGKAKLSIVQDLADRMDMEKHAKGFKVLAKEFLIGEELAENPLNFVNATLRLWATTSGDHDFRAVAFQRVVAKAFKLGDGSFRHFYDDVLERADEWLEIREVREWFEDFARAQYEATQELLKDQGIEYLTLARGILDERGRGQGAARFTLQPASSFSADLETAIDFSQDGIGRVMVARIHRTKIMSCSRTGMGCLPEYEFIVLGDDIVGWISERHEFNPFAAFMPAEGHGTKGIVDFSLLTNYIMSLLK